MSVKRLRTIEHPAVLAEQLDMVARKLETRAGLEIASLRPDHAAEWAAIIRRAQDFIVQDGSSKPRHRRAG